MAMLNDREGSFKIYQVQYWTKASCNPHNESMAWHDAKRFIDGCVRQICGPHQRLVPRWALVYGANGDCWQQTSENGVFRHGQATTIAQNLAKKHPDERFRVILREIVQRITPLMTLEPTPSEPLAMKKGA
jgi:hypothetical protein